MMLVRPTAFKRIITTGSSLRRPRAASSRHVSSPPPPQEPNQALHQGLEQLQKRPPTSSSTTTTPSLTASNNNINPNAAYTIANKPTRLDRLNQALINAAGSFLVVLLAAQSYKAAAERRRALDHLEAATEVLKDKQNRLKQLIDPASADDIAAACRPLLLVQRLDSTRQQQQEQQQRGFLWTTKRTAEPDRLRIEENVDDVQQQLSAIIHEKLCSMIDPKTDLDEEDRDKELVRELVRTIELPTRKQVFTI
jgi:hypothetical protein